MTTRGFTSFLIPRRINSYFDCSFGLGYLVKSINIGIDARYNLGLTDIVPSNYGSGGSEHGSVVQVGIFYLFGRGK